MLTHGGVCGGAFAARRLPARAARQRRCLPTPVQAAAASDAQPATDAAPKRKPTRKRMIDAMLREAEARKGGAAVKAPPGGAPRAAAAAAAKPKPKRAPAPAQEEDEDEEEEVLDLSAYLGGSVKTAAPRSFKAAAVEDDEDEEGADLEGTADSFGGVLEDEDEDAFEDDGPDFLTAAVVDEPGAEQPAPPGQRLVNTWQYDSDVGEVVFKRVPQRKPRPSAMASSAALQAMLARMEADEAADSDGEAEFDPEEAELDAELRVPTALQKVDTKDVDEVITALSGMNTMFLDKESQALLDEELSRKKKARTRARR
jgi:hypothetical protein